MKTIVPNYYKDFKCIANKCHHNCCIGWEIDIDDETLNRYKDRKGKFSRKLKNGIEFNGDFACFKLDGKGRCVFLNEKNLCDIILNIGENSLCQICTDHPRFRNYYSNRTEIGLGLCCEEAGRIIVTQNEAFSLVEISDDLNDNKETTEEIEFFKYRKEIFEKLQNDENAIFQLCSCDFPNKSIEQWADIFLSLERLDEHWTIILNDLKKIDIKDVTIPEEFKKCFKNLLIYFTYRHLNEYSDKKELMFIYLSCEMIKNLCKMHIKKYESLSYEDIIEYARMYSSEIEYSDENIEKLIEIL